MCAIFGSFKKDKFLELAELNSYRGQHSFSVSLFDPKDGSITICRKEEGKFDCDNIEPNGKYMIGHIQAPTTQAKSLEYIHPSVFNDADRSNWYTATDESWLWHNGIIKEDNIRFLQNKLDSMIKWDTALLHQWFMLGESLDKIDGTFSCLLYRNNLLYMFRNEISPMFVDGDLNISSTKFENATRTKPNQVLLMDFNINDLVKMSEFQTKENPYYFANGS